MVHTTTPGHTLHLTSQTHAQLPRSRVQMDIKMVALLAKQQALRAQVEREQLELSGMNEKLYRKAQREAGKIKFDIIRVRTCLGLLLLSSTRVL